MHLGNQLDISQIRLIDNTPHPRFPKYIAVSLIKDNVIQRKPSPFVGGCVPTVHRESGCVSENGVPGLYDGRACIYEWVLRLVAVINMKRGAC